MQGARSSFLLRPPRLRSPDFLGVEPVPDPYRQFRISSSNRLHGRNSTRAFRRFAKAQDKKLRPLAPSWHTICAPHQSGSYLLHTCAWKNTRYIRSVNQSRTQYATTRDYSLMKDPWLGYEDAVRLAILLGGDADTLACIAGGIAGAMYGVPTTANMNLLMPFIVFIVYLLFVGRPSLAPSRGP
jgi:hypothetical protein